jgi:DNA-binding NarL/FixJ family response regulator
MNDFQPSSNFPQERVAEQASLPQIPQRPWRVLVVEDDPQTRAFFVQCIARSPALELAAEAASVQQAKTALEALKSSGKGLDALLTDLGLPDGSGLQIIGAVAEQFPACDSLVISMFGDEDNVLASIEAGATGYIHKDAAPEDVAQSIIALKAGASPISPMIARRLLAKYRDMSAAAVQNAKTSAQAPETPKNSQNMPNMPNMPTAGVFINKYATNSIANTISNDVSNDVSSDSAETSQASQAATPTRALSRKETEILEAISRGHSYAELAALRHVSVHTVQSHIKNIYAKLSVHNRSQAVFEATRLGYLKAL